MDRPMVALHLWNDGGRVTFRRNDEGQEFLNLVAAHDEPLSKNIDDAWWATTPRPFLLRRESKETILRSARGVHAARAGVNGAGCASPARAPRGSPRRERAG